ncbi:hypothetical protein [Actinomadura roseirufa]|uniref:hypothetical protein n=1 Tax=Actinomadura roseirufa TaxID=2094049 RepID=UPI00104156B5|nr:hypothetical protein [Actinomadura roseirufa]
MKMRFPVTTTASTLTGDRRSERGPRQRRVRVLAVGALFPALLAFATAIEYGLAVGHGQAALASDGTAHVSVVTNGDGTALGLGRY